MAYTVTDNFLPESVFQQIQDAMLSPWLPWYYNASILGPTAPHSPFQFTHTFYLPTSGIVSPHFASLIEPIVEVINPIALLRVKANLGPKTYTHEESGYHTDFTIACKTAVLYLNTNNGSTKFDDGTVIESVANRFVEFDSHHPHTGVSQTDTKVRCLINFNYIKQGN
jgi:hypothetical protein